MTKLARLGLLLLPLILSGCSHRRKAPPLPPQSQAPPIPTQQAPTTPPQQTPPPKPAPAPVATAPAEEKPEPPKVTPKPRHTTRTKRTKPATPKPTTDTSQTATAASVPAPSPTAPAPKPTQQAAAEGTGLGSPIGQLTSGASDNSVQRHKEVLQLIESTDQGVNNLKRSLNSKEKETVTQIRVFLKQAKEALNSEDIDGATNLANKAKVLLDELTK